MSEPENSARKITRVMPDLLHWTVQDDRIQFRSDSHAVREGDQCVLIDPLPLEEKILTELGHVGAICLTGSCHQRAAWRYRRRFGVKVYAPQGAEGLEETADVSYGNGERLPGELLAVHAPGPTRVHYAFLLDRGDGTLFCADILVNREGELEFVPDEHMDEPGKTRDTARKFLNLKFSALCFDHGAPMTEGAREAIERLLSKSPAG